MKRKHLWPLTFVVCGILMLISAIASNVGWITFPLYKAVIAIPLVWKCFKKKEFSSILLVVISGVLGILLFGF